MLKIIGREILQPFYWQWLWWLLSSYSLPFNREVTMIQKLRILTLALVALFLFFASGVLVDGLMIPADKGYVDGQLVYLHQGC